MLLTPLLLLLSQMDVEIITVLPVRTQTGPFAIPVECTPRRVKPKLSNGLVVFRGTVVGEREVRRKCEALGIEHATIIGKVMDRLGRLERKRLSQLSIGRSIRLWRRSPNTVKP